MAAGAALSANAGEPKHPGTTVHGTQHEVRPLGSHLRVVKPIAGTRKPAKTILTKHPS